jgi:nucleotide-binding universal stress UspA family protein
MSARRGSGGAGLARTAAVGLDRTSTVLLATDGTIASTAAEDRALRLARESGARLLLVSVVDEAPPGPDDRSRMDQRRAARERAIREVSARAREAGVSAAYLVWSGPAGPAIVEAAVAEAASVIVVGARARAGHGPGAGGESVSRYVASHAHCPVIVAPGPLAC